MQSIQCDAQLQRYFRDSYGQKTEISQRLLYIIGRSHCCIMVMFHSSNHKCLKHFYLNEICLRYRHLFPETVSYNRFTELDKSVVVQFVIFVKKCLLGKCMGISTPQHKRMIQNIEQRL